MGGAALAEIKLATHPGARSGEGEICARGPQMLVGYLRREDEAQAFDAEGFFRTGDLGRWVDDKYLVVTGRAKDIIIRNGENISPKEVEDLLIGHPQIAEIAIVGLPDPRTGERACAVIVPKMLPGPDVASLRSFLDAQGVATFKAPEQVVIAESLPRNDAGKVSEASASSNACAEELTNEADLQISKRGARMARRQHRPRSRLQKTVPRPASTCSPGRENRRRAVGRESRGRPKWAAAA